jgi:Fe-S oxidoreductase
VVVLATCALEHEAPDAGRDLVALLDRAGVGCELAEVGCCGAPWLHAGDLDRFRRAATATVRSLAGDARPVLVADPVCRAVLARSYPDHVAHDDGRAAADVAVRVADPASVVGDLVRDGRLPVPDPAPGVATRVVHVAEHAADPGGSTRPIVELLERIGVAVDVVERAVGAGVTWGWRRGHHDEAERLVGRAAREATDAVADAAGGSALVTADDARVAHALSAHVGHRPSHPLSVVARRLGVVSDRDPGPSASDAG